MKAILQPGTTTEQLEHDYINNMIHRIRYS